MKGLKRFQANGNQKRDGGWVSYSYIRKNRF